MCSQKKEAFLQAKWSVNFVKKANGQRMSFELARSIKIPAKLLLDLLLPLQSTSCHM